MCTCPSDKVAYEFVLSSPAVPPMSCSSYVNGHWDGRKVAVQLLFCQVLLSGFFKTAHSILRQFPSGFFSVHFASILVVHPYNSLDSATACKKNSFSILLDRSDFHLIDNLSIAFSIFHRRMLTSLSVDEMLLPRYVKLSTNFRVLPLREERVPFRLKHMYSLHSCRSQYFLLHALDNAGGIVLVLVYLR